MKKLHYIIHDLRNPLNQINAMSEYSLHISDVPKLHGTYNPYI